MKFWKNRKGNIAVLTALTLPVVVGGAGLGVETGYWYYSQLKLQQAADAAVYAADLELHEGNTSEMLSSARAAATLNGYTNSTDTISVATPSASYPSDANSADVSMTRSVTRGFSAIFNSAPIVLHVKATAKFDPSNNACLLALSKSSANSVWIHGNGGMTISGCVVSSNSVSSQSIVAAGSSSTSMPCISTAGGVSLNSNVTLTDPECTAPQTNLPPVSDPYKGVALPTPGPCQNWTGNVHSEGTYCDSGINLTGKIDELTGGTYIFNGTHISISGGTNGGLTSKGAGVTIVLLNGAYIEMTGNPPIDLTAPTTGPYAGMLFLGDRTASGHTNVFAGTATSKMTGVIYFPADPIQYAGNFSGFNGCTQVVAYTIEWTGSTSLSVNCSGTGMNTIKVGGRPYLVG
ncbi:MAG: pilus assembly protein TadG-related protein [Ignavibacteriales bacterium]